MKQKVLFVDRDGVIIKEDANDPQIDSIEKLSFVPQVFKWLGKIADEREYELVMVTNQDGMSTESFPAEKFWPIQNLIIATLAGEGIHFKEVHIDSSMPHENKPTRKPGVGMLTKYFSDEYDLPNSFVIGDRISDLQLAKNLGAKGILFKDLSKPQLSVNEQLKPTCALETHSWAEVYAYLKKRRLSRVTRVTNETKISIQLNLDGTGSSKIKTGLNFFDHMLEQIARHSNVDLDIEVDGDLQIDEHHTIEDTGIALGEAFAIALGKKIGITRYGFTLPMDDCLAQVAIDFGGRPWLVWNVTFKREKIGDVPTEMFFHFFKSFSDSAKCNLNVKAEGENEHHKIESVFKAFARSIRQAVHKDGITELPSTKGIL